MKNSGVQLGAIADDFTGVTDLASILARSGQSECTRRRVGDVYPTDSCTPSRADHKRGARIGENYSMKLSLKPSL